MDGDFITGFFIGFILTLVAATVVHVHLDSTVSTRSIDEINKICTMHKGTKDFSVDTTEITGYCDDGFTLTLLSVPKGDTAWR